MIKRVFAVVATVAVLTSGSVALAESASATPDCNSQYMCAWDQSGYTTNGYANEGIYYKFYIENTSNAYYAGTSWSAGPGAHGISSDYNNGTGVDPVWWFDATSCNGSHFYVTNNQAGNTTLDATWNNKDASATFYSQLSLC